jgi:hypothetical protein
MVETISIYLFTLAWWWLEFDLWYNLQKGGWLVVVAAAIFHKINCKLRDEINSQK